MTNAELFGYLLPVVTAALSAAAAFLGAQIKKLYQRWVDDRTKEAVVRTCVQAAEQLYHHLDGAEKLARAKAGITEMLAEKGITITQLEMDMLIESTVSQFNYGFSGEVGQK